MKIRTRLRLNTFISIGVVILILLSMVWSFREVSRTERDMELADKIRMLAFDRITLRDDYLLHGGERARTLWYAKSKALRDLFAVADSRFEEEENKAILQEARKSFDASFSIFSRFLEGQEIKDPAARKKFNFTEAESGLINQVIMKAYALTDNIERLHESVDKTATIARNKATFIIVIFIIAGVIAIISNSTVTSRTLAKRITALGKGVEIIGAGNLDYRIVAEGDDELSALALASNEMTVKLKASHTSVENLSKEIAERKQAEVDLRRTNAEIYDLYNNAPCGYHLLDKDGVFVRINNTELSWLGHNMEDVISKMKFTDMLTPWGVQVYRKHFQQLEKRGHIKAIELEIVRKDGTIMPVLWGATAVKDESEKYLMSRNTVYDMTDLKKLESQLRHAQKMEAIGQLAGGIAHDFNNIMSAIINYAYLIKNTIKEEDPLQDQIERISSLSMKASEITRGLLAFSRKNITNLMPTNINNVLLDMGKLLSKFIGEDIEINSSLSDKDLIIMADKSHLEQVIINLATNARDAMPERGSFTIETDMVSIGDDFIHMHGFGTRGTYALLSVTDTGIGMDEETKHRIFEPFFTTKEVGKGTGLGMAIVYGIVKQHEGYINVYSEPGRGTTFKIYFPVASATVPEKEENITPDLTGHAETILLAEDETAVRISVKFILEKFGYSVIEAVNGDDAIEKFREHKDKIELLLFDVIMPKKNGKEAYEEIKKITPGIKVIFTSGYSADILDTKGVITNGFAHISKPLLPDKLLSTIKEMLQSGKESPQ